MGIVSGIITTIIKSALGNKVDNEMFNDLIGISIDGISGKCVNEIKDFINGEKFKIEYILSEKNMKSINVPEEKINYVVAEIRELLSNIGITDEIIRSCNYSVMKFQKFLWGEYCKNKRFIEYENEIKTGLYSVAEVLVKLECESNEFEERLLIHISGTVDDAKEEVKKISSSIMKRFDELEETNQSICSKLNGNSDMINSGSQKKVKSRTLEYAKKWNDNMFLNNFNKRDEHAGVNVKLKDVYLEEHLPHYIWRENQNESDDLKDLLSEYIEENEKNTAKSLLILGQPGIGKSTLITWITANFSCSESDILVYQFASDLKSIDWNCTTKKYMYWDEILGALGLTYTDLNGKVLIFDGFDEINVRINRIDILNKLLYREIKGLPSNFSVIITCRENYIYGINRIKYDYIILQPWDEMQIKSFCKIYSKEIRRTISKNEVVNILNNKEILGIPLILYMTLALSITIEKEGSMVDIYDKTFSIEGGIYDRCIDNRSFADYHWISEIKKQIHQISRGIAIWMFENNPDEASISRGEYEKICAGVAEENESIKQDFLIGNYFKLIKHCEGVGTEELYFVHRSIYEYFVTETIFSSIENSLMELSDNSQEEFARNIAVFLKKGCINYFIAEYLQYKILKLYAKLKKEKQKRFYQWWENAINKMMEYGMFYYTKENVSYYRNIMSSETRCFLNLLEILRLLTVINSKEYIMENIQSELVEKYIKYCCIEYERISGNTIMNLSKMFLSKLDLKGVQLKGACLDFVNLEKADLRGANLEKVSLIEADLQGADLTRANLQGANLERAKLIGADLKKSDLRGVNLIGAYIEKVYLNGAIIDDFQVPYFERKCKLYDIKIFINKTQEIIDYDEYCKRIQ